jgi:hypothetical protein
MSHVSANVVQQGFRGRNDDGSQSGATWKAALNTNWSQNVDEAFRVRVIIEETAGGSANNYSYTLQYNLNSGGWVSVGVTGAIHSVASSFVSDATATTQQISSGAFVAGEFDSDSGASNISLESQKTEMEYSLIIDGALVSNGDQIQIRATNSGTALNGYTNTPSITVVEVTVDQVSAPGITSIAGTGAAGIGQQHQVSAQGIASDVGAGGAAITDEIPLDEVSAPGIASGTGTGSAAIGQAHQIGADGTGAIAAIGSAVIGQTHLVASAGIGMPTGTGPAIITSFDPSAASQGYIRRTAAWERHSAVAAIRAGAEKRRVWSR